MTSFLKRAFQLVEAQELSPDNDPMTIAQHADANTRFSAILRAKSDWLAAQHKVTTTKEQLADDIADAELAGAHYRRALEAMEQLFRDNDIFDAPLPGEITTGTADVVA